jgi:hypothetical protein
MISFVFYFSSRRIDNLRQTLRFLSRNENLEKNEVVLVCNDSVKEEFYLPDYKLYNLNLDTYNKPKLCNFGVSQSKNEIIALLDSDRIMPYNYFENISKNIRKKQFVSNLILHKLDNEYNDEEIENKSFRYGIEIKSKKCEIRKKNLFSGNTIFYKKDYLSSGGMDESFEGYGFADNDMTYNIMSKGYNIHWNNEVEIHLYHPIEFLYKGKILSGEEFKKISRSNLEKLKNKWQFNFKRFLKI